MGWGRLCPIFVYTCVCVFVAEQFITGRLMESGSLEGSSPASSP